jgi:UDP-N-acetylmuramoyl-tripeptide--D-alanyl-D-alanine ligase
VEHLFTLGTLSSHASARCPGARHFDQVDALLEAVRESLPGMASIVVKGSRFMKMERVIDALTQYSQEQQEGSFHAA